MSGEDSFTSSLYNNFIKHFDFRISVAIAKDITAMTALQKKPTLSQERTPGIHA